MLATLEKWLGIAGSVLGALSGLLVVVQSTVWPGGPPHWMAVVATVVSVAGLVVAKLLEVFSTQVQAVKGQALVAKASALQLPAPGGK